MDTIAIVDFGGQYAHLLGSRIRRLGVYTEVLLPEQVTAKLLKKYKGLILSGGGNSVYADGAPTLAPALLDAGIPVLAVCYGHQLVSHLLGGTVQKAKKPEFGPAKLTITKSAGLFKGMPNTSTVWMSHGDEVTSLPAGFEVLAKTPSCAIAAAQHTTKPITIAQFHAEVTHTAIGEQLLKNFITQTKAKKEWNTDRFLKDALAAIKKQVGKKKVFLLASGGVDSTVAFALLAKALPKGSLYALLVDHGLMRAGEAEEVKKMLLAADFPSIFVAHEEGRFLGALKNAVLPEDKRRIIGRAFLDAQKKHLKSLKVKTSEWLLGQGTIYPDTIESGGTKHADTIKTHHNRVPEIAALMEKGLVVEPLKELYKDEVRAVGRLLGLPASLVDRHPFPGPGLGVRLITAKGALPRTTKKIEEAVKKEYKIPCRVLPVQSVGVQGDSRTYAAALALFPKVIDLKKLIPLGSDIPNAHRELNRVVVALAGKESPKLTGREARVTKERADILRAADSEVTRILRAHKLYNVVWQFPVVLAPISSDGKKESIILRPIESLDAMTATLAPLPLPVLKEMAQAILKQAAGDIEFVFLDITPKPPATIEWE